MHLSRVDVSLAHVAADAVCGGSSRNNILASIDADAAARAADVDALPRCCAAARRHCFSALRGRAKDYISPTLPRPDDGGRRLPQNKRIAASARRRQRLWRVACDAEMRFAICAARACRLNGEESELPHIIVWLPGAEDKHLRQYDDAYDAARQRCH